MLGEGSQNGGDAEADVLCGSDGEDGEGYYDASDEGAEGWVGDVALEEAGDGVSRAGEEEGGEAEGYAGGYRGEHGGGVERGLLGDGVDGVVDTPEVDGVVACECGDEAGEDGVVAHVADGEDFKAEDGSGEWGAKDGAEAGADAGHEEGAAILLGEVQAQAQDAGELVGESCSGLDGGALAAGGASEEMGDGGAEENERGHPGGDGGAGCVDAGVYLGVDLVEDKVVAAFDAAAEIVVDEAYRQSSKGEEGDDPAMGFAGVGGPIEADEEDGGC